MLEFENVSKSFWAGTQRKVILDRISFRVELGRSIGNLAPNGTGKTTLVNMMADLEKPDKGEIRRGCKISFPLGFMGGVITKHTAMENSRYIARLHGLDPDYVEAFCRWLCGLGEYFDQPLGIYSSGMRARFTFALQLAALLDNNRSNRAKVVGAQGDLSRFHALLDRLNDQMTNASQGKNPLAKLAAQIQLAQAEMATRDMFLASVLEQLEQTRRKAASQARYLTQSMEPLPSQDPSYPRKFENTILAFLVFAGIYLMISLTASILREQVSS